MRYAMMLTLLAGLAARAAAQAPTDTVRLTLDDAVHRALEQGVDMRLARAAVLEANGQVREAFSPALPQVTGSLTYTRQFASIYSGLSSPTTGSASLSDLFKNTPFGAANTWNLQLQATQLLWSAARPAYGTWCPRCRPRFPSSCRRRRCWKRLSRQPRSAWRTVLRRWSPR